MAVSSTTDANFDGAVTILGIQIIAGSGAPTLSAPKGSLYLRTDGSYSARAYINTNGSTTWTAVITEE